MARKQISIWKRALDRLLAEGEPKRNSYQALLAIRLKQLDQENIRPTLPDLRTWLAKYQGDTRKVCWSNVTLALHRYLPDHPFSKKIYGMPLKVIMGDLSGRCPTCKRSN
jgi:hypothetical protein